MTMITSYLALKKLDKSNQQHISVEYSLGKVHGESPMLSAELIDGFSSFDIVHGSQIGEHCVNEDFLNSLSSIEVNFSLYSFTEIVQQTKKATEKKPAAPVKGKTDPASAANPVVETEPPQFEKKLTHTGSVSFHGFRENLSSTSLVVDSLKLKPIAQPPPQAAKTAAPAKKPAAPGDTSQVEIFPELSFVISLSSSIEAVIPPISLCRTLSITLNGAYSLPNSWECQASRGKYSPPKSKDQKTEPVIPEPLLCFDCGIEFPFIADNDETPYIRFGEGTILDNDKHDEETQIDWGMTSLKQILSQTAKTQRPWLCFQTVALETALQEAEQEEQPPQALDEKKTDKSAPPKKDDKTDPTLVKEPKEPSSEPVTFNRWLFPHSVERLRQRLYDGVDELGSPIPVTENDIELIQHSTDAQPFSLVPRKGSFPETPSYSLPLVVQYTRNSTAGGPPQSRFAVGAISLAGLIECGTDKIQLQVPLYDFVPDEGQVQTEEPPAELDKKDAKKPAAPAKPAKTEEGRAAMEKAYDELVQKEGPSSVRNAQCYINLEVAISSPLIPSPPLTLGASSPNLDDETIIEQDEELKLLMDETEKMEESRIEEEMKKLRNERRVFQHRQIKEFSDAVKTIVGAVNESMKEVELEAQEENRKVTWAEVDRQALRKLMSQNGKAQELRELMGPAILTNIQDMLAKEKADAEDEKRKKRSADPSPTPSLVDTEAQKSYKPTSFVANSLSSKLSQILTSSSALYEASMECANNEMNTIFTFPTLPRAHETVESTLSDEQLESALCDAHTNQNWLRVVDLIEEKVTRQKDRSIETIGIPSWFSCDSQILFECGVWKTRVGQVEEGEQNILQALIVSRRQWAQSEQEGEWTPDIVMYLGVVCAEEVRVGGSRARRLLHGLRVQMNKELLKDERLTVQPKALEEEKAQPIEPTEDEEMKPEPLLQESDLPDSLPEDPSLHAKQESQTEQKPPLQVEHPFVWILFGIHFRRASRTLSAQQSFNMARVMSARLAQLRGDTEPDPVITLQSMNKIPSFGRRNVLTFSPSSLLFDSALALFEQVGDITLSSALLNDARTAESVNIVPPTAEILSITPPPQHLLTQSLHSTHSTPLSIQIPTLLGIISLARNDFGEAELILRKTLMDHNDAVDAWRWLGHSYFCLDRNDEALHCYVASILLPRGDVDASLFLRMGLLFHFTNSEEHAAQSYLHSALLLPSSAAFLGAGVAYLRLQHFENAELCLSEANFLNPWSSDTWGFLCVLCLEKERNDEAAWAFNVAKKNSISNFELLGEIASYFLRNLQLDEAEEACQLALAECERKSAEDESEMTQLMHIQICRLYGDVLYARSEWITALTMYQQCFSALSSFAHPSSDILSHIVQQYAECLSKLGRTEELEKFVAQFDSQSEELDQSITASQ
ncbi:hypothetical protein BLNAU_806 [Blattamonas nauphoetae]|uniref:Uncharacterized protein n=1 Tax=Blattamonas nauphoetae TaxID=2049346 RepID=A0ABQ9YKJ5_9EUKA|nr:hypothetical protein BLNAU_806 [Blattamonas nauphoetae]